MVPTLVLAAPQLSRRPRFRWSTRHPRTTSRLRSGPRRNLRSKTASSLPRLRLHQPIHPRDRLLHHRSGPAFETSLFPGRNLDWTQNLHQKSERRGRAPRHRDPDPNAPINGRHLLPAPPRVARTRSGNRPGGIRRSFPLPAPKRTSFPAVGAPIRFVPIRFAPTRFPPRPLQLAVALPLIRAVPPPRVVPDRLPGPPMTSGMATTPGSPPVTNPRPPI